MMTCAAPPVEFGPIGARVRKGSKLGFRQAEIIANVDERVVPAASIVTQ